MKIFVLYLLCFFAVFVVPCGRFVVLCVGDRVLAVRFRPGFVIIVIIFCPGYVSCLIVVIICAAVTVRVDPRVLLDQLTEAVVRRRPYPGRLVVDDRGIAVFLAGFIVYNVVLLDRFGVIFQDRPVLEFYGNDVLAVYNLVERIINGLLSLGGLSLPLFRLAYPFTGKAFLDRSKGEHSSMVIIRSTEGDFYRQDVYPVRAVHAKLVIFRISDLLGPMRDILPGPSPHAGIFAFIDVREPLLQIRVIFPDLYQSSRDFVFSGGA